MPKPERTHFSYNGRIHMLYCEEFPMRFCLSLAQILDGMSFDDIARLSRVIMQISNGFFPESALKASVNEKIGKNQVKKYRSNSHEKKY